MKVVGTVTLQVNGHSMGTGLDVQIDNNYVTFIPYGIIQTFNKECQAIDAGRGQFTVNGKFVVGYVYQGMAYLPWAYLGATQVQSIPGGHNFIIPYTATSVFTPYTVSGKPIPSQSNNAAIYSKIPVLNQESLGDCTIFALYNWMYFMRAAQGLPFEEFAECAGYFEEMNLLGTPGQDAGGYTWSAVATAEKYGAMLEQYDDYTNYRQNFKNPPPNDWLENLKITTKNAQKLNYTTFDDFKNQIRDALSQGFPILFGVELFESIFSAANGVVVMPQPNDKLAGGHELAGVDYDDSMFFPQNPGVYGYVRFRNSWGPTWGTDGDGFVSYEYLYKYALGDIAAGVYTK